MRTAVDMPQSVTFVDVPKTLLSESLTKPRNFFEFSNAAHAPCPKNMRNAPPARTRYTPFNVRYDVGSTLYPACDRTACIERGVSSPRPRRLRDGCLDGAGANRARNLLPTMPFVRARVLAPRTPPPRSRLGRSAPPGS